MLGVEEAYDFTHRIPKLTLHAFGRNAHSDQPVRLQDRPDFCEQQSSGVRVVLHESDSHVLHDQRAYVRCT